MSSEMCIKILHIYYSVNVWHNKKIERYQFCNQKQSILPFWLPSYSQYMVPFHCKYPQGKKCQLFLWLITIIVYIFPTEYRIPKRRGLLNEFFFFFCTARRAKNLLLLQDCSLSEQFKFYSRIRPWEWGWGGRKRVFVSEFLGHMLTHILVDFWTKKV